MRWQDVAARFAKWRRDRLLVRGNYLIDLAVRWNARRRCWLGISEAEVSAELTRDEDGEDR